MFSIVNLVADRIPEKNITNVLYFGGHNFQAYKFWL